MTLSEVIPGLISQSVTIFIFPFLPYAGSGRFFLRPSKGVNTTSSSSSTVAMPRYCGRIASPMPSIPCIIVISCGSHSNLFSFES